MNERGYDVVVVGHGAAGLAAALAAAEAGAPATGRILVVERAPARSAYPLACAICYTFGGLETDADARVIGDGGPIPGLFAAGEITGQFYAKAPGGTSVLRALVFGRIAGRRAIRLSLAHSD